MKRIVPGIIVLLLLPAAAVQAGPQTGLPASESVVPATEVPGLDPEEAQDIPIGPEDLLEISVFEFPELNLKVRVSEDGSIYLPLLGEIQTDGLTVEQLQERLRDQLAQDYLKDPQVSVFVREHGSKRVSVLGTVAKPGVYEVLGTRTLLQVLSQAGGLQEDSGEELYLIRTAPDGEFTRIAINLNDLMLSHDPKLNHLILPGDIISVPRDVTISIYVDGAVKTPGRLEEKASRPVTLLQAIARAGGPTERANLKGISILRQQEDGTQLVLEINLKRIRKGKDPNPVLLDGDVIVVPETFF